MQVKRMPTTSPAGSDFILFYLFGMFVCGYAVMTYSIKADKRANIPFREQMFIAIGSLLFAIIWPICLAVWMRDIKENKK